MHPFASAINRGENASRLFEHYFAGNGEGNAPRRAIEQLRTHFGFELRNLMRDSRLRKIAGVCRAREMAELGHSDECS